MASLTIITTGGEVLDAIVQAHYGATSGIIERVIAANRGLAAFGPILPAGVSIVLPDLGVTAGQPVTKQTIRLWD